jgi:hypothetical protein
MSPDELRALREDIQKNGLASPIKLWRADSKAPPCLIDGRSRLDGIETMGHEARVEFVRATKAGEQWALLVDDKRINNGVVVLTPSVAPYIHVISANIRRRHLTGEQARDLIAKLLKVQPEKSNRQIAETAKTDHKTIASVRAEQEARGEIPHVSARTDTKGRHQPARKAPTKPNRMSAPKNKYSEARDDIGPDGTGEVERLRARNEELETRHVDSNARTPRYALRSGRQRPHATSSAR